MYLLSTCPLSLTDKPMKLESSVCVAVTSAHANG